VLAVLRERKQPHQQAAGGRRLNMMNNSSFSKSSRLDARNESELKSRVFELRNLPAKSVLKTSHVLPLRPAERERLAQVMSVDAILDTSVYGEDGDAKRKRRWKEIRHLYSITQQKEYSHCSLENALWFYGHNGITANHFSHALMHEFGFAASMKMDAHLKWLYWSFEGGTIDRADWRAILASFRIVILYRLVKKKPVELLLSLFDIYAVGGETATDHPNDVWYVTDAFADLRDIFTLPCLSDKDAAETSEHLMAALDLFRIPSLAHAHAASTNTNSTSTSTTTSCASSSSSTTSSSSAFLVGIVIRVNEAACWWWWCWSSWCLWSSSSSSSSSCCCCCCC